MHDYKLLEAFTAVVENGGFEKASKVLHLTQSAVSQRVRLLEETIGQILLVRSNPPEPTDAGRDLITHFKKVQMLETELDNRLIHKDSAGYTSVSIGLNADSLCTWFFDAVEGTVKRNNILLQIYVDDQEETHRMMKDGEVSACISTRSKPFQSCSCTYLGTMTYKMYASPEIYEKHFANGFTAETLADVPVIIYNDKDTLQHQIFKKAFRQPPTEFPFMYMPDFSKYIDSVLRGFGIGMMPYIQCAGLEQKGLLKDAFAPHTIETPLYWHRWNITSTALDAMTKAITNKHMLI